MTQLGKKIVFHRHSHHKNKAQLSDCQVYGNQLHATYLFHDHRQLQEFRHQSQQRINSNCCCIKKIRSFRVQSKKVSCENIYFIRLIYDFWGPEQTLAARYLFSLKQPHKHLSFSEEQADNILDSIVLGLKKFQEYGYRFPHLNMNNIINENQVWVLTEIQPYHSLVRTQLLASPEQILYQNRQIYQYCHLKSSLYRLAMIIISLLKGSKWNNLATRPEYYQICEQIHSISKHRLRQKLMILSSLTPEKRMRIFGIIKEVNTGIIENMKTEATDLDVQNISTIIKNSKVRKQINKQQKIRIKTGNMENMGNVRNMRHVKGQYRDINKIQGGKLGQDKNIKFIYRSNSHSTRIKSLSNPHNIQNVKFRSYQSSPSKQSIGYGHCESAISTNRIENEEKSSSYSNQMKGQSTDRGSKNESNGTKIKWKSDQQFTLNENGNVQLMCQPVNYPTNKTFIENLYTNKTIKSTGILQKTQQNNSRGRINSIKVLEGDENMRNDDTCAQIDQQYQGNTQCLLSEVMVGYHPMKYNPYASNTQDKSSERLIIEQPKDRQYTLNISKTEKFMDLNNGFMYLGQCFQNVPHGHGSLYYATSQKAYEGQWLHGTPHGIGIEYPNANFQIDEKVQEWEIPRKQSSFWCEFEGSFKNGLRDGKGILKLKNGDIFKGVWQEGKTKGSGLYLKVTGQTIKGQWENNKLIQTN